MPDETIARRGLLDDPLDHLLLVALGVIVTLTAGVWLVGQLAGLLFTASWPPVGLGEGLPILGRLPRHLDDPRRAWPPDARGSLPGLPGFAVSTALTVAMLGTAGAELRRRMGGGRGHRGFASRRQLQVALSEQAVLSRGPVIRPSLKGSTFTVEDVGVRLGRSHPDGMPLAITAESSVLLLAAPRQGKTSQIVIPWLHRWPGPALVTSVRPDIVESTALLRATGGRPVLVMAPTGMIGWPHLVRWSPLFGCEGFDRARARADVMVTVGKSGAAQDSGNAAYFGMTATNLMAGWLLLGFEHVDGRHADLSPTSPDLPAVADLAAALSRVQRPGLPVLPVHRRWAPFADESELRLLRGDTLVHMDLTAENILIGQRIRVVDWAWPTLGAAWLDAAALVVRLIQAGHTPAQAEQWARRVPAWRHVTDRALAVYLQARTALGRTRSHEPVYRALAQWQAYRTA